MHWMELSNRQSHMWKTFCPWLFLVPFWNHTWNQLHLLPSTMKSLSSLMPKQGSQNSSPTQIARPTQHCTGRDLSSSESRYAVKCWEQAIQKIWLPCHLFCREEDAFCQLVVVNRLEVLAISSFNCHSGQDTHKRGLHIQHPPLLWGWRRRCCGRLSFVFSTSKQGHLSRSWISKFWAVGAGTSSDLGAFKHVLIQEFSCRFWIHRWVKMSNEQPWMAKSIGRLGKRIIKIQHHLISYNTILGSAHSTGPFGLNWRWRPQLWTLCGKAVYITTGFFGSESLTTKTPELQKFPVQTTFVWVISPDDHILSMKTTKDPGDHFLQTKLRDVQVTVFPVESLCHCIGSTTQPDHKRLAKLPCFALLEAENCGCFLQLNRWHDSQLQLQKALQELQDLWDLWQEDSKKQRAFGGEDLLLDHCRSP